MTVEIWTRTKEAPYEIWLAFGGLLFATFAIATPLNVYPLSLLNLFDGNAYHPALVLWAATFGVGGLLTLVGRYNQLLNLESAGLAMMTAGIGVAALASAGQGRVGVYGFLLQSSLALATAVRLFVVRRAVKAGNRRWT